MRGGGLEFDGVAGVAVVERVLDAEGVGLGFVEVGQRGAVRALVGGEGCAGGRNDGLGYVARVLSMRTGEGNANGHGG